MPSRRPIPAETKHAIAHYVLLGYSQVEAASFFGVSTSAVGQIISTYRAFGTAVRPEEAKPKRGPLPKLTHYLWEDLKGYLLSEPQALLQEMQGYLLDNWDITISTSTICTGLKAHKWTRKRAQREALERSAELRSLFQAELYGVRAEHIVAIDEAGANEKAGWRRYCWSPEGTPGRYTGSIKRGKRYSVLPAYTVHGYIPGTTLVREGAIHQEDFEWWLKEVVLPRCGRWELREPNSVIIMDNCAIHHSERIEAMIEANGTRLIYLPPYSPDLNPIELSFGLLKQWILKTWQNSGHHFDDFGEYLRYSVEHSGCDGAARQHWRHCGYLFESDEAVLRLGGDWWDFQHNRPFYVDGAE